MDQLDDLSEWDSSSVDMENEYIPPKDECEDSTDDSFESEEIFEHRRNKKRTAKKDYSLSSKSQATGSWKTGSNLHTTSKCPTGREDGETPLSPSSVCVLVSKKSDGKRIYDKRQYCHFCETSVTEYARHLERCHSSVAEVAKALSYKKKTVSFEFS